MAYTEEDYQTVKDLVLDHHGKGNETSCNSTGI